MVMTLEVRVVSMGSRPASLGSQRSASSTLPIAVFWCSPATQRLSTSAAAAAAGAGAGAGRRTCSEWRQAEATQPADLVPRCHRRRDTWAQHALCSTHQPMHTHAPTVTALLMARPMALSSTEEWPFSGPSSSAAWLMKWRLLPCAVMRTCGWRAEVGAAAQVQHEIACETIFWHQCSGPTGLAACLQSRLSNRRPLSGARLCAPHSRAAPRARRGS